MDHNYIQLYIYIYLLYNHTYFFKLVVPMRAVLLEVAGCLELNQSPDGLLTQCETSATIWIHWMGFESIVGPVLDILEPTKCCESRSTHPHTLYSCLGGSAGYPLAITSFIDGFPIKPSISRDFPS